MNEMRDNVWQRRGTSLIWDEAALAAVAEAPEVWSVRELVRASSGWAGEPPEQQWKRARGGRSRRMP